MADTSAPRAFGRRMPVPRPAPSAPAPEGEMAHAEILFVPETDQELEDWKRARRWQPPWRQIALTASLCFGIAAFVLPASVNDAMEWLLYGLSAISLISGLRRKSLAAIDTNRR